MKWNNEKDNLLLELLNNKKNYKEISEILNTTYRSVTSRCLRLGFKKSKEETKIKKECLNCHQIFESHVSDDRKFCGRSCGVSFNNRKRILSEETKKKIKNSNLKNCVLKERKECLNCGKKVKKSHHIYCSKKCSYNSEIVKEKIRSKIIERYKNNPESHPNRRCSKINETYPERFFREFLTSNNLIKDYDFFTQYPVEKYYVDFYFPSINLVVEIDGEQWHDKNSNKEITRENIIKKYHNIIRFDVKPLLKKQYEKEILNIISKINAPIAQR
jgi:very-short-patch-repair endonuclease